ncbi:MAG: 4Fe-4S dicluster domain-containing protein, partial [Desulfocucumaceae bacterium]
MIQNYDEWQEQLVKCIRCGTCRSVCPVFQVEDSETTTARGKIHLLEAVMDGKQQLTPIMQGIFNRCLLCMACAKGCPSGVDTGRLFLTARQALAEKNGLPFIKKLAFTALKYRKMFDVSLRSGAGLQNLFFKKAPDGKGYVARLPVPAAGLAARRVIPPLTEKPLTSRLPRIN